MPGFNGKGPEGKGPLTGRRRGRCRDKDTTESVQTKDDTLKNESTLFGLGRGGRPFGGGKGQGFGGGRRRRGIGRGNE